MEKTLSLNMYLLLFDIKVSELCVLEVRPVELED